jgi:signal transduction histidine kinase
MLQQAKQPISLTRVPLAPIIGRATEIAEPALSRTGIELRVRSDPALPEVNVDEVQIELALLTLIHNAMDAMPRGGVLEISTRRSDAGIGIEVRDSGGGIPSEILPRLFEPWVTTKPLGRGTGLGLSIVRDIVREHGGTVTVENRAGEGATFLILLPAEVREIPAETHAADTYR